MKRWLASEWTALGALVVVLLCHAAWFEVSDHQGDVLTGLGGSMTLVGVFVAAQPYIRKGLAKTAREQAGLESLVDASAHQEEAESEALRHVVQERIAGVTLIGVGSLLNGYGLAIARLFGLKGL